MSRTPTQPRRELARRWPPPSSAAARARRWLSLSAGVAYLVVALASFEVDWSRVAEGVGRGARFAAGFVSPDFSTRWTDISAGLLESLAMSVVATLFGVVLSVPVAVGAARNVAPWPLYLTCRAIVTVSRSLHELIVAIFFVVMVGFGPLAGVLTLTFASVGFLGKLLAEDIESTDPAQVDAVRATGAGPGQRFFYGLLPQVAPRLAGLTAYRLDINFRESVVIGVVGAGGIGATLNTAFDRYEYDTAAAVLLLIVGIVLAGEYASGRIRARLL